MKLLIVIFSLVLLSGCNVLKSVTDGETNIDDNFFSNNSGLNSNNLNSTAVQDTEKIITLSHSGNIVPTTCSLNNLSNVTETTPCSCSSGNCTVGLTGSAGYYGVATANYILSSQNESSNESTITINIDFTCPTGYSRIGANTSFGISSDFCVMTYEARNNAGTAVSQKGHNVWVNITHANTKVECQNLGAKYDLISNPEWMVIAREIESIGSNWTGGTVGSGCIFQGNVGTPSAPCGYDGANPETDGSTNTNAELNLNSGDTIWDFSGNVFEAIDWTVGGTLDPGPTDCSASYEELSSKSCSLASNDYLPNGAYGSANGAGMVVGGASGYAIRGGNTAYDLESGVYNLNLSSTTTNSTTGLGFRCVYRPY